MLDFKELSTSGDEFELLIRELLYNKGLEVYWSGKGADGGRDLVCVEKNRSYFKNTSKKWLIQCKHNAHSGKSVGLSDLDNIVDSCEEHGATGYLLVCSTYPSSAVVRRLEQIQSNGKITTAFWDYCILERELMRPENWSLIGQFMPISAKNSDWRISNLETCFWHASYKNNIFYISLRMGSNCEYYLRDISDRLDEMEQLELPEGHILRLRAVYFDEKHCNYRLYLDYMVPHNAELEGITINENVIEFLNNRIVDGVYYDIDLIQYDYMPWSDHFDIDHQCYYNQFIDEFKLGSEREEKQKFKFIAKDNPREFTKESINHSFDTLVSLIKEIKFINVLKGTNAQIEYIDQFPENFTWENTIKRTDYNVMNFFDAQIRFECEEFDNLTKLLECFPNSVLKHFYLKRDYIFMPDEGFEECDIYTLYFTIHPGICRSKLHFRTTLNEYLAEISAAIRVFLENDNT